MDDAALRMWSNSNLTLNLSNDRGCTWHQHHCRLCQHRTADRRISVLQAPLAPDSTLRHSTEARSSTPLT